MKMSSTDFNRLAAAIAGLEMSPQVYADRHPEFSSMRIRWDFFAAACGIDSGLSKALYATHNDTTMDTALKHIIVLEGV